jgi:type VI secretion system secreted protein VgrG
VETQDGHQLVLMSGNNDAVRAYPSLEMLTYQLGRDVAIDHVLTLRDKRVAVASAYKARDYNMLNPDLKLRATLSGAGQVGTVYDYPGGFDNVDAGDRTATRRIHSLEWPQHVLHGTSAAPKMAAGARFDLKGHVADRHNQSYLILSVQHRYDRHSLKSSDQALTASPVTTAHLYENTFEVIPYAVPYAPRLQTPKPKMHSAQSAKVIGPEGEAYYTDAHGRIKVQFFWEDADSSLDSRTWVRVAQNWAGNGFGAFVLPRIGMEVLVTFLNGDPDQPVVTGCLYNGGTALPAAVASAPWKSSFTTHSLANNGKSHELTFDDKARQENILLRSAKDLSLQAADALNVAVVGHIHTVSDQGNIAIVANQGDMIFGVTKGNHNVLVKAGDYTLKLDEGGITIDSASKIAIQSSSQISIQSEGDLSLGCAGSLTLKGSTVAIDGALAVDIKTANFAVSASMMSLDSQTVIKISAGVTVSMDFPGKTQMFPLTS